MMCDQQPVKETLTTSQNIKEILERIVKKHIVKTNTNYFSKCTKINISEKESHTFKELGKKGGTKKTINAIYYCKTDCWSLGVILYIRVS